LCRWCFPDEGSVYADRVLVALEDRAILVPAVWALEIANAVLVGERNKRLGQPEIRRFIALLAGMPFIQDTPSVGEHVANVTPLAREYGLSAYDAAYLELSIRHGVPLATLDGRLQKGGAKAGVDLFGAG
jgi:predicted nucleic acid-binding protein